MFELLGFAIGCVIGGPLVGLYSLLAVYGVGFVLGFLSEC